ncbi:AzlC family ABC transporter permease [Kribbella kalugense]|uniref:4-azaleucine resistance transporter AzlC n=1 Tax=Kribbella kalugense TaxID=2512221 RepID=A0A4R7ZTQ2_9ACTN|nr:AzlC family ABC transporter permease [Kribbella kalugense]TDW21222.1 4-azaleucine resistance transporter AzlC [Kribbella kalugense]
MTGSGRQSFARGLRLGIGPGLATGVLALNFGAEARARGWGMVAPVAFSAFAFSGSAQFTLLSSLSGATVLAAIVAAMVINVRYLVMSVAIAPSLRGSRFARLLQAQAIVDASFVAAHDEDDRYDVWRLIGVSVPQWICWTGGTAVGVLAAPSPDLMHRLGLDVAFPAFFIVLLIEEVRRSHRAVAACLLGAAISAGLLFVTSPSYALLGAAVATLIGLRRRPDEAVVVRTSGQRR